MKKKNSINALRAVAFIPDDIPNGVKVFMNKTWGSLEEGQIYTLPKNEAESKIRAGIATRVKVKNKKNRPYRIPLAKKLDNFIPQMDLRLRDIVRCYQVNPNSNTWWNYVNNFPDIEKLFSKAEILGTEDWTFRDFEKDPKIFIESFKAVACLIRLNPIVIHIPFIVKAIENFLVIYQTITSKRSFLMDLKDLWLDMLPQRQGGNIPFSEDLLRRFLMEGIEEGYTKEQAINLISRKLGISQSKLTKIKIRPEKAE